MKRCIALAKDRETRSATKARLRLLSSNTYDGAMRAKRISIPVKQGTAQ